MTTDAAKELDIAVAALQPINSMLKDYNRPLHRESLIRFIDSVLERPGIVTPTGR